jgi:hypothetical protein
MDIPVCVSASRSFSPLASVAGGWGTEPRDPWHPSLLHGPPNSAVREAVATCGQAAFAGATETASIALTNIGPKKYCLLINLERQSSRHKILRPSLTLEQLLEMTWAIGKLINLTATKKDCTDVARSALRYSAWRTQADIGFLRVQTLIDQDDFRAERINPILPWPSGVATPPRKRIRDHP